MEMCRACLIMEQNMVPLNEAFVSSYNLLTHLNVSLQDSMPQLVCLNCVQIVKSFIEFREKSIISETTLQQVIQDTKLKQEELNEGELCIKQEVKKENETTLFDDDYFDDPCHEYREEETNAPVKIKKEPGAKKKKQKRTSNKESKKKNIIKTKHLRSVSPIFGPPEKPAKDKVTTEEEILPCDDTILKKHLHSHTKTTECEICHERFTAWPGLLGHRIKHLSGKPGHCHLCNKRFVAPTYLEYHYITAHNDGQQTALVCSICQRTYKTPKKLNEHVKVTHSAPKFFCDHCSKGFTNKSILRGHIKTHNKIKSLVCDLCGFRCKLKVNLRAHQLRKHTPGAISCKSCSTMFVNQERFDKHKCNQGESPCSECGKIVLNKSMSRHMEQHGEARHRCALCPAAFRTPGALRVHRDRHDGVRRHQCEYCHARFYSLCVLIKHRRVHTGEKPYVCTICGKAFTGRHNLKVHLKVHGIHAIVKKDTQTDNESFSDLIKNTKRF